MLHNLGGNNKPPNCVTKIVQNRKKARLIIAMSASAEPKRARAGDDGWNGPHPDSFYEGFEDPALAWIKFVVAVKSGDPSRTRPMTIAARNSNWTELLWLEATAAQEDSGSETDPWVGDNDAEGKMESDDGCE